MLIRSSRHPLEFFIGVLDYGLLLLDNICFLKTIKQYDILEGISLHHMEGCVKNIDGNDVVHEHENETPDQVDIKQEFQVTL